MEEETTQRLFTPNQSDITPMKSRCLVRPSPRTCGNASNLFLRGYSTVPNKTPTTVDHCTLMSVA